jgi:hypothetical protein
MDWRPIDTAPKDGTWIVALAPESFQQDGYPSPYVFTTRWNEEVLEHWERADRETMKLRVTDWSHWEGHEEPTHWMPPPKAPDA